MYKQAEAGYILHVPCFVTSNIIKIAVLHNVTLKSVLTEKINWFRCQAILNTCSKYRVDFIFAHTTQMFSELKLQSHLKKHYQFAA